MEVAIMEVTTVEEGTTEEADLMVVVATAVVMEVGVAATDPQNL